MKPRWSLALVAAALGCGPAVFDFSEEPVVVAVDDDDVADPPTPDPDPVPPALSELEVSASSPAAGPIPLSVRVVDPDSDEVAVTAFVVGEDSVARPLTLADSTGLPNRVTWPLGAPIDERRSLTWLSAVDIPTLEGGLRLRLCVEDDGGLDGGCVDAPSGPALTVRQVDAGAFCEVGDLQGVHWVGGRARVPLGTEACPAHRLSDPPSSIDFDGRFDVVVVNPADTAVELRAQVDGALRAPPPPAPVVGRAPPPPRPPPSGARDFCEDDLHPPDVHRDARTFFVRTSAEEGAPRVARGGTLRALGSNVAVYVDESTPIDTDLDCDDPFNAIVEGELPAFGFTNCDLETIVEVFDLNLHPTIDGVWGGTPDVDQNCRTVVFVTHRVNQLVPEPPDPSAAVRAFSEPHVDLRVTDLQLNPSSNEQEVLFLHAPDPLGLWGPLLNLDDYLSEDTFAALARAQGELLAYAAHRGIVDQPLLAGEGQGPPPPPAWLQEGLGALSADLTGFGGAGHADVWRWLDAPHLQGLTEARSLGDPAARGAPYLFARYLYEQLGPSALADLARHPERGLSAIDDLAGLPPGGFLLQWATAMAVSGRTRPDGAPLVPDALVPGLAAPTTLAVPDPANPVEGDPVGANGHQQGFTLHGMNRRYVGGGTATPVEIESFAVRARGIDPLPITPEEDLLVTLPPGGVAVVRVMGIFAPTAEVVLRSSGASLLANVVRIDDGPADPAAGVVVHEEFDGALVTTETFVAAPWVDRPVHVFGRIDAPQAVPSSTPGSPAALVADTDRYTFWWPGGANRLVLRLSRRADDEHPEGAMVDPFVAIALADDVPDIADSPQWGIGPRSGPCASAAIVDYPLRAPDWLAAQGLLIPDPTYHPGFSPPGGNPGVGGLPCVVDHDADGIPNDDEPRPTNLIDQIRRRQADLLEIFPDHYVNQGWASIFGPAWDPTRIWYDARFVDIDSNESPDDDLPATLLPLGLGGRSTALGEDALWVGLLRPLEFTVIVGDAGGGLGPYTLEMSALPPD